MTNETVLGLLFRRGGIALCAALGAALALNAGTGLPVADLAHPDEVLLDGRPSDRVTVAADGTVTLAGGEASYIQLRWKADFPKTAKVYGSQWERTYGQSAWRALGDARRPYGGALNWYVLLSDGARTDGYGVKVQPNAFASWRVGPDGLTLLLDVRAGSRPVQLGARTLAAVQLVSRKGRDGEGSFAAARAFCRMMCPQARLPKEPVFGYNDWYCTYGHNTATNYLEDVRHFVKAFDGLGPCANRPFAVVDDGWQDSVWRGGNPGADGQWAGVNPNWGLPMDRVAAELKAMGARAGLWYRPLKAWPAMPESWLLKGDRKPDDPAIDPTAPGVAEAIERDLRRFRSWGYELVKIDFLTLDWGGQAGGERVLADGRSQWGVWGDRSRTTAEVVLGLYRRMRTGAGDMIVIGCNAIDHFAAGLFELQRTGQDVSGFSWGMTRLDGVNTLGLRAHHNNIFYQCDPDCVCLAGDGYLPWGFNRQWLDAVARSGTSLFVSWPRALAPAGSDTLAEIARAWRTAARTTETAEPLDWEEGLWPRRWRFPDGRQTVYDWRLSETPDGVCGTESLMPSKDRRTLRLESGEWTADVDWTGRIRLARAGRELGEARPVVVTRGKPCERPVAWEFRREGATVVSRNDYEGDLKVITAVSLAANGEVKVRQDCAIAKGWGTASGRVGVACGRELARDVEAARFERPRLDWTLTPADFERARKGGAAER